MWKRNKPAAVQPVSPEPGEHEEAAKMPNGFVYRISGNYGPNDGVPPEAIVGAWKVNEEGKIFGEFTHNPNYDPSSPAANKI